MSEIKSGDSLPDVLLGEVPDETEEGDTAGEAKGGVPIKEDPKPAVALENKESKTLDSNSLKELEKAKDAAHLMALSHIETVFSDKYTDEERKEFFEEHPELAGVANRSKRFKERYRSLGKKPVKELKTPEMEDEEDDDSVESSKKRLPTDEIETLSDKVLQMATEKQIKSERYAQAYSFAERNGLTEDEFNQVQKTAEAIYSTAEVEYDKALVSALTAIGKKDIKTVNLPFGGKTVVSTADNESSKEQEIKSIMSQHRVGKVTAEKIFNSIKQKEDKGVKFDIDESVEASLDYL